MSNLVLRSQGSGQPEYAGTQQQSVAHVKSQQKTRKTHQGKKGGVPRSY
jgi:hypothetical protein